MRNLLANKYLLLLLKICIVVFSLAYIYNRIFLKEDIASVLSYYRGVIQIENNKVMLLLVVLLMLFNWSIESEKWRFLIKKIEKISFLKSLIAIFTGVTVSIFTPNRIGEYAGRVFFLKKADRIKAIIITLISSAGQLLITAVVGTTCLLPYMFRLFQNEFYMAWICATIIIVFNVFYLLIFIHTHKLMTVFYKIKRLSKIKSYLKVMSYYSSRELTAVLLLSALRYLIFTIQFLLLLKILNVQVPLFLAIESVGLIFLSLAIIPTFALVEIGVRGSVAIYFLSKFSSNELGIMTASFTLWFINLVVPALLGCVFVFGVKNIRKNSA